MHRAFNNQNYQWFQTRRKSLKKHYNPENSIKKIKQKYELSEEREDTIRWYMNDNPFIPPRPQWAERCNQSPQDHIQPSYLWRKTRDTYLDQWTVWLQRKDTSEEDPKINIKWRWGNHDKNDSLLIKKRKDYQDEVKIYKYDKINRMKYKSDLSKRNVIFGRNV